MTEFFNPYEGDEEMTLEWYSFEFPKEGKAYRAKMAVGTYNSLRSWTLKTSAQLLNFFITCNIRYEEIMPVMYKDPHTPALAKQVGGSHYKGLAIQPFEYIHANNIPFAEGCAIKYLTRWRSKGGIADLEKAKHFIELLIDLETRKDPLTPTQSQS